MGAKAPYLKELMEKKWMYKGNLGILAVDNQIEELKDYFTQNRPDDFLKFEQIHFGIAIAMVNEAKEMALMAEMNKEAAEPAHVEPEEAAEQETEEPKKQRGRPKKE